MDQGNPKLECMGFKDGGKFSIENTGLRKDISTEFIIKNLSPDAKTQVITLEDLSPPINRFLGYLEYFCNR